MPPPKTPWTDKRSEQVIGLLLRSGVILAAAVVSLGAVFYLIHHAADRPAYHQFRGEPENLRSIAAIVTGAAHLHSPQVIQFGLVLLLLTPVARVAFSVFSFAAERDWTYVIVTLIVLAVLLSGILLNI